MKTHFRKSIELFGLFLFSILFTIIIISVMLCLTIKEKINIKEGLIVSLVTLTLFLLVMIVESKNIFSKITISIKGIGSNFLRKSIFICWDEITGISERRHSMAVVFLVISRGKDKIEMQVFGKMYKAIMILCPDSEIKSQIRNLDSLKWWVKREDKLLG